jgi:alkylation response protein AidB-like acyl-CoA dehydrogenase
MALTNPFNEEHKLLRQSVRKFVETEIVPNVEEWEKNHHCSKEVFHKMGQQGYIGASFPENVGGSGMDFWAAVVVTEEMAKANVAGLSMSVYAHTHLPLPLLKAIGNEEQKQKYLTPALRGEKITGLGITEPNGGSDVFGMLTTAKDMGDYWELNGSKTFITNGTIADFVIVLARTGEASHFTLFIVDANTQGFSAIPIHNKLGMHSSDTAQLFFENCKISKSNVLGKPGHGFYYQMNNFQEERLLAAVSATAMAEWALEKAKQYTKERKAFGKTIVNFQAVRHILAQMAIKVEACRSISYRAVAEFVEKGNKAECIISMAKAFTTEECEWVVDQSLQLHGGNGYVEDYGIARAWRDCRLLTVGGGTTQIMYEIISKLVLDDVKHENKLAGAKA